MKQIFLFISIVFTLSVESQVYNKKILFQESFNDNTPSYAWNRVDIENSIYAANINNESYLCYLPYDNGRWNWTYVGFPNELRTIFNQSAQISLAFDFTFVDNQYGDNFGLMFDLHGVTDACPGGSFYELYFSKKDNKVSTFFRKNDNCNLGEEEYFKWGDEAALLKTNHLEVRKIGLGWSVFINNTQVLDLNFNGNISLDRLKYGKGRYRFDNFEAYSTSVNLPTQVNSENINSTNQPKIWALCVGVEDYSQYPGYPNFIGNLSYTVDDAKAYIDYLHSTSGGKVPQNQTIFLSNTRATNSNILHYASELFSKAAENDLIIVFLSGHGGNGYFCASNDALRYEELNKVLEKSDAKRKLLIADACHSGSWAKQKDIFTPRGEKLTENEALELFYNELSKSSQNVTYLLAARPNELSWETEANGHGVFTYYLIEGLSCKAGNGSSPIISISDIYDYLSKTVYEKTKYNQLDNGKLSPQHPVLEGRYDKNMPVGICVNY